MSVDYDERDGWRMYDMAIPTFLLYVTAGHGKEINSEF
jgi:hypothetical protein